MIAATKQCWMEFAAVAPKDQDPKKLIELARKINERLDERFQRPLPEQKRSDPDVLADLRDAMHRVRNAAWAVQQYVVRKESDQDSNSVLSFLAGERIRIAYQLCQALSDDLNRSDLEFQREQSCSTSRGHEGSDKATATCHRQEVMAFGRAFQPQRTTSRSPRPLPTDQAQRDGRKSRSFARSTVQKT